MYTKYAEILIKKSLMPTPPYTATTIASQNSLFMSEPLLKRDDKTVFSYRIFCKPGYAAPVIRAGTTP